ncbi:MAG: flagellin FliC [Gammaproteobacteria bacterium]|nr:flagellin FliC [Gammaproteobacteria bacterium]PCH62691.1 MAG: flagellin FliC [Gammaproteobacteria bacterium]PCH64136.1 MAG: flagellin FliC [Gammaproteobacteria bacterium]
MALTVNTNIASLNAQRNLASSQNELNTALQRLSTGLRLNSARDDAAGLFVAEQITADIRGLNQATRNAQDGISLGQVAEGALGEIANNLQRIREIAVQSANVTVQDRSGLQQEVDQLTQEISRIVATSQFNGTDLLSGAATTLTFQIGQDGLASNQVSIATTNLATSGAAGIIAFNANLSATGTIDVSTAAASSGALSALDVSLDNVSRTRATFGAIQNRFEAVISNLSNTAENLTAARGRIIDADFAVETANLTRAQIIQQAGVSVLSQANSIPQLALSLLQ